MSQVNNKHKFRGKQNSKNGRRGKFKKSGEKVHRYTKHRKNEGINEQIAKLHAAYANVDWDEVERFTDLPLSDRTQKGLAARKYVNPTPIQKQTIKYALTGEDILGAAQTGSGKTLAFLIPIFEVLYCNKWMKYDGVGALVITPTRELAYQIFETLRNVGHLHDFSAGLIIGGKDLKYERQRMDQCNIVICTPGRLLQHMDENPLFNCDNLQILVLDEADRCLDMGFAATMNAIIENLPPHRQTFLYSATQTKSVNDLVRLSLKDPKYVAVDELKAHVTPDSLSQLYSVCQAQDKLKILYSFLCNHSRSKVIIFFATCKEVRFVHQLFCKLRPSIGVNALHGGIHQLKRLDIYDDFCKAKHQALFCTDVAARGLDFPNVGWVFQFDCPEDTDTYIHRVGRTARCGSKGSAFLLLLESEAKMIEKLTERRIPIEKVDVNENKLRNPIAKVEMFIAKEPELKMLAQLSIKNYIKNIAMMKDKSVFDATAIDTNELAYSYGLAVAPRVRLLQRRMKKENDKKSANGKVATQSNKTVFKSSDEEDNDNGDGGNNSKQEKAKKANDKSAFGNVTTPSNNKIIFKSSDEDDDDDDEEGIKAWNNSMKEKSKKADNKFSSNDKVTGLSNKIVFKSSDEEDGDDEELKAWNNSMKGKSNKADNKVTALSNKIVFKSSDEEDNEYDDEVEEENYSMKEKSSDEEDDDDDEEVKSRKSSMKDKLSEKIHDISDDDDEDDDFLTVKRRNHELKIDDKDLPEIIKKKKEKAVTRVAVVKKTLRKGITVNTRKVFGDDDEDAEGVLVVGSKGMVSELGQKYMAEEPEECGINIEKAREVLANEDYYYDRKRDLKRVKDRKQEEKKKLKEEKAAARHGVVRREEGGEGEYSGEEDQDVFDEDSDEGSEPDVSWLPDPDKIYGPQSDANDDDIEDETYEEYLARTASKTTNGDKSQSQSDDDDDDDDDNDEVAPQKSKSKKKKKKKPRSDDDYDYNEEAPQKSKSKTKKKKTPSSDDDDYDDDEEVPQISKEKKKLISSDDDDDEEEERVAPQISQEKKKKKKLGRKSMARLAIKRKGGDTKTDVINPSAGARAAKRPKTKTVDSNAMSIGDTEEYAKFLLSQFNS